MSFNTIEFHTSDGVAELTLNRPDQLNSFNAEMHGEIRQAMQQVKNEKHTRCLLLTGAGRGFCAGQDLNDRAVAPGSSTPDLGESVTRNYNPLIRSIMRLEKPVICAVNGVAAGAGANLALACDIVLAARSAKFILGFSKIGLIPDSGGTWNLPRLIGRARATGLAMLNTPLPAEQAEQWGLIWQAVDDDKLLEEARTMAAFLASQPTLGLGLTKRAFAASAANSLEQQLAMEAELMSIAGASHDYREGVAAFIEKRQARFTGE